MSFSGDRGSELHSALEAVRKRVDALRDHVSQLSPDTSERELISESLDTLQLAVEALRIAEEESLAKHKEALTAQRAIEQERARYRALFEFTPDSYLVTDPNGIILEANSAAVHLLSRQARHLVGKPIQTFVTPPERVTFRQRLLRLQRGAPSTIERWEFQLLVDHGRTIIDAELTVELVHDLQDNGSSLRWMIRNATVEKALHQELIQTNALFRALIEATPVGIIVLDLEGRVFLWNRAVEAIFGWQAIEVTSRRPPTIPPSEQQAFDTMVAQVGGGRELYNQRVTRLHQDGSQRILNLSVVPIKDESGSVTSLLEVMVDITENQRLNAELQQTKRRLAESREGERVRLAHDLHDDVIQQLLGLGLQLGHTWRKLLTSTSPEQNRESAVQSLQALEGDVVGVVQTVRAVIRNLRPPGLEEFGLEQTLEGYLSEQRRALKHAKPQILLELDPISVEIPFQVSLTIFRVAQEVVSNTLKHADAAHLYVQLSATPASITLNILDDGRGFQLPEHWSDLLDSNRFGLMSMLERVELVGGTLHIFSKLDLGTVMSLLVPLETEEQER